MNDVQYAPTRLLIIEDEPDLQELLRYNLSREGFDVVCTDRGEKGLELVRRDLPALVVLDLMLPGMDGLEVCRAIRHDPAISHTPIVMLTARDQESDIVLGLELGADDYVTKPYSWRELLARLKAVLRRRSRPVPADDGQSPLCVGRVVIDPARHAVTMDGRPVDLTATEFKLLKMLASRPGRVFTRQQMIKTTHGQLAAVTDRSIDVQVSSLRRKLIAAGDEQAGDQIETIRGIGYRFREAQDDGA